VNEFSLINQYFTECGQSAYPIDIDIGDDAAVLSVPSSSQLVMTMDTLIENVHFPSSTSASDIAHKALAVNLSDLAAMGATPAWFLLSISLPEANEQWLKEFSQSLCHQAKKYAIKLIGGDTCQGALSITIQATGMIEQKPLLRSGAQMGDYIFVSGALGAAAMGLNIVQNKVSNIENKETYIHSLNCPTPRFDVSNLVKPYAHAMIDLSDGLLADLGHILKASQCGANVYLDRVPMPSALKQSNQYHFALSGGDDYELCFTVPIASLAEMNLILQENNVKVYEIGQITSAGLNVYHDGKGELVDLASINGYQHFG